MMSARTCRTHTLLLAWALLAAWGSAAAAPPHPPSVSWPATSTAPCGARPARRSVAPSRQPSGLALPPRWPTVGWSGG